MQQNTGSIQIYFFLNQSTSHVLYYRKNTKSAGLVLVNIITLVLICLLKDYLQVENYIYENLLILPIQVYHEPS